MSWEVLTMRSATSFFNPALARSDLRRYWPALFLYVGLWIIFLPVQLWLMAHQGYVPAPDLGVICSDRYIAAVIMALIFGGMMAMASFSYLMNPRSVGAMHALPQRRGTLFWTHFLTGWGMLAAGNLLVALLTAGIALLTGVKLTAALLTWLVVVTLLDLFFMALGTFCAMITGWLLAVPVLYGVANTLALIVTWLGQQLADGLLLGYAPPDALPRLTVWLTPVYRLIQEARSGRSFTTYPLRPMRTIPAVWPPTAGGRCCCTPLWLWCCWLCPGCCMPGGKASCPATRRPFRGCGRCSGWVWV